MHIFLYFHAYSAIFQHSSTYIFIQFLEYKYSNYSRVSLIRTVLIVYLYLLWLNVIYYFNTVTKPVVIFIFHLYTFFSVLHKWVTGSSPDRDYDAGGQTIEIILLSGAQIVLIGDLESTVTQR